MTSPEALAQSLPLWVMRLAFLQNLNPNRFPNGSASRPKPTAGCVRARSGSTSPPTPTREEPSPRIPKPSASRPTSGSDAAGPGIGSVPNDESRAGIPANPTMSATPTTAPATDVDCAIPSHQGAGRISHRSRPPSLSESNADRALQ